MRRTRIVLLSIVLSSPGHAIFHTAKRQPRPDEPNSPSKEQKNDWMDRWKDAMTGGNHDPTVLVEQRNVTFLSSLLKQSLDHVFYFQTVYDTRPPRDLWDGMWSAMNNMWLGYFSGFDAMLSYPWQGFQTHGLAGLLVGSVQGIVSGALLATGGIVTGLYQLARGVERTPIAMRNSAEGMVYDADKAQWEVYSLDQEHAQVTKLVQEAAEKVGQPKTRNLRTPQSKRHVKDVSYYNMLRVPVDASPSDIKHAYYREALLVHPDKNMDDVEASIKFQQLSSAYQILSNEETREAYDMYGTCTNDPQKAAAASPAMDPSTFFAIMFGSYLVEPYIGELAVSSIIDNLFQLSNAANTMLKRDSIEVSLQQRRRQVDIALNLRDRVADYVNGKESKMAFQAACHMEAEAIRMSEFGYIFLTSIGSSLISESNQYLGLQTSMLGLQGQLFRLRNQASSMYRGLSTRIALRKTVRLSVDAFQEAMKEQQKQQTQRHEEKGECDESNRSVDVDTLFQKLETSLSTILDLVWAFNMQDISVTLHEACSRLFTDTATSEVRLRRADAVRTLGQAFFSVGVAATSKKGTVHPTYDNLKKKAEAALLASIVKEGDDEDHVHDDHTSVHRRGRQRQRGPVA